MADDSIKEPSDQPDIDPTEAVIALTAIVPLVAAELLDEVTDRETVAKVCARIADQIRQYSNRANNKVAHFFLERTALNFENMEHRFLTLTSRGGK